MCPIAVTTIMGLAVLINAVIHVALRVLLVVLMHSGNALPACLHSNLFGGARCVPLEDCCVDWHERCDL